MPNTTITYEELRSVAGQLRAGQQELEGILTRLNRGVDVLTQQGFQTDSASRKFYESNTQWTTSTKSMLTALHDMGSFLEQVATEYQNLDQRLSSGT